MISESSRTFWNFVIDFGDFGVLAPATAAICVVLWLRRQRGEAIFWGASFFGCVIATALLKAAIGRVEIGFFGYHCKFARNSDPLRGRFRVQ